MMLKEKSNHWARLKVLLLIPPAIFVMFAFARPDYTSVPGSPETFKSTQIPEESKKWNEEFFQREYRKNASRLKLSQHYDKMLERHRIVLMDRKGSILLDNEVLGMISPPSSSCPSILLTLSGKGVEEVRLSANDVKQLGQRLDEVENLKQYTRADLSVKKDRIDSAKEQILQVLRERGILKVNLKATE